jgi:ABC-type nitrate/sulfonate/bicarbonate transport system substrate-binding protein
MTLSSERARRHPGLRATLLSALLLGLAACGPTTTGSGASSPSPSATDIAGSSPSASPSAASSPSASAYAGPARPVRLALDWTPNTNHTGFFVAQAKDWYRDAGVDLQVLPYSSATPEALIAAGQAECGISFQDAMTFAVAAGAPTVSVMAILQHTAQEIAVLDSSAIKRPRDLDGKTYAGFGYPNEDPTLKAVIKADGGKGDFTTVTLDTAAYEALYAKRADFVITFSAWEGIEAGQRGIPLRTFAFTDYGFPDFYQVVLACDRRWLDREPDLAKAFVSASARGFEFAADHPDDAAAILVAQNPGVFDGSPDLPAASQRFLADGGYLLDAQGIVGRQTLERWQGYSGFLYEQGLLADANGKPLAAPPGYAGLFSNAYLP